MNVNLEMKMTNKNIITNTKDTKINNKTIKATQEVVYLSQIMSIKNRYVKKINRRMKISWNKHNTGL